MNESGVVRYAQFLFTRNQQRDFTAFVRPPEMSNKDVSALANAFNYVNDITPLTPESPALYCFPLGGYLYLLRHYDSGRKHAGRAIPVIEGIAIRRQEENALGVLLAQILTETDLLDVVATIDSIEALERRVSEVCEWTPEPMDAAKASSEDADEADASPSDAEALVDALATRYATEWLLLPFDERGRETLLVALGDERLPILHFAFGANAEVVAQFKETGVTFDVVGYASVEETEFRPRDHLKAIDVREILPDAAAEPSNFAPSDALPPLPDDLAEGRTAPVTDGEPIPPIYEEWTRRRTRRKRSLLRRLVDALLGR